MGLLRYTEFWILPSHRPHRLQTTLTPAQTAVSVTLRKALRLLVGDVVAALCGFLNPDRLALRPRPLPAATWGGQSAGPGAAAAEAPAPRIHGP